MSPLNNEKCGFALPLVLVSLLAISLLLASLSHLPGMLRSTVKRTAYDVQQSYLSESAVIANLEMLPEGFFPGLPKVQAGQLGPWLLLEAGDYSFLVGKAFAHFRMSEWLSCARLLEGNLKNYVMSSSRLQRLSGNRRFFEVKRPMSLMVESGDLELNLDSNSRGTVEAVVEGDVLVKGNVHLDTLRLYSSSQVILQGRVNVDWLEVYGTELVSLRGDVNFKGIALSRCLVELRERSKGTFPSLVMAIGQRENVVELMDRVDLSGAAIAPGGEVHLDVTAALMDSFQTLLPYCMDSKNVVFERKRGGGK